MINDGIMSQPPPVTMKKPRAPRFSRVAQPPKMVLTPRDREILHQVYLYRLMTREQIERLLFAPDNGQAHLTKTSKARRRLRLLYHHGFLERIPALLRPGVWAYRPVYRLSRKGATLVATDMGTSLSELAYYGKGYQREGQATQAGSLFLNHTLEINDVHLAISLAAAACGYRLEEWLDDWQLKKGERRDYVQVTNGHDRVFKVAVIPDAYFVLILGDRRTHFFLEVDRGTMTSKRWKTRVLAYQAYLKSDQFQTRYQTKSLIRILTITTTAKRMQTLVKATQRAQGNHQFWFTTRDQIAPESVFSSPIWRLANDEADKPRKTLIE